MKNLSIPIQKLLGKMEEELSKARGAGVERQIREHVHAIRTLCELILENHQTGEKYPQHEAITPPTIQMMKPVPSQIGLQGRRLQEDDEANGDSLFDF